MRKTYYLFLGLFVLLPLLTQASTAIVEVDTLGNSINALETTIVFPKSIFISKIMDGNSVINFWIKTATLDEQSNSISFSGLTPGGFVGQHRVLAIVGDFKISDLASVSFQNITALKNDGEGTSATVKFFIKNQEISDDSTPPEPFALYISKAENIFDNKYFLSFATQDKGLGVDHYEYADSWFGSPSEYDWKRIASPMELSSKSLFKKIFIKAIDKSGNERMQSTVGVYYYYLWSVIWIIILVIVTCALFSIRRFSR